MTSTTIATDSGVETICVGSGWSDASAAFGKTSSSLPVDSSSGAAASCQASRIPIDVPREPERRRDTQCEQKSDDHVESDPPRVANDRLAGHGLLPTSGERDGCDRSDCERQRHQGKQEREPARNPRREELQAGSTGHYELPEDACSAISRTSGRTDEDRRHDADLRQQFD